MLDQYFRPKIDTSKSYTADWVSVDEENDRVSKFKMELNDTFTLRSSLLYEQSDRGVVGNTLIYTRTDGLYDVVL
ncbi:hypothetical protein ACN2CX_06725 [Aliarcobacter butzleri]|uniref:hypothetical protein n=1 Tax=Aliarcobacter butzleri TaxID=28197 RepID=UPI003AFA1CA2